MNDSMLARDAELLERAVRGELGSDDAELAELIRRRPDWGRLIDELDGEAAEELLARTQVEVTDTDRRRMSELVARVAAAGPKPSLRPRWLPPLLLAAVLVLIAGAIWWAQGEPPVAPPRVFLGGEVRLSSPVGIVDRYGTFAWDAELPRRGSFLLIVLAEGADGRPGRELAREELSEPSWTPAPERIAGWPERISWTLDVLDAQGLTVRSGEARAQLASR